LGEAANFNEFWHRPQQLSDLNTLPWDNAPWMFNFYQIFQGS
jgi:hypothetical protein